MEEEIPKKVLDKYNHLLLELQRKFLSTKTKKLEQFIEIRTEMNSLMTILQDFGYTTLLSSQIMTEKEAKERMAEQKAEQDGSEDK